MPAQTKIRTTTDKRTGGSAVPADPVDQSLAGAGTAGEAQSQTGE